MIWTNNCVSFQDSIIPPSLDGNVRKFCVQSDIPLMTTKPGISSLRYECMNSVILSRPKCQYFYFSKARSVRYRGIFPSMRCLSYCSQCTSVEDAALTSICQSEVRFRSARASTAYSDVPCQEMKAITSVLMGEGS